MNYDSSFSETKGTFFYRLRTEREKVLKALAIVFINQLVGKLDDGVELLKGNLRGNTRVNGGHFPDKSEKTRT